MSRIVVRTLDPAAPSEIRLVATWMRETLVEVLGQARGGALYTEDWLLHRVRWHLDRSQVTGEVFLAEIAGAIAGHTIVRLEPEEAGETSGLFSTIFVAPALRRQGVARALLHRGEGWMRDHQMTRAVTYTDVGNSKLQTLFVSLGYEITPMPNEFVRLSKSLDH